MDFGKAKYLLSKGNFEADMLEACLDITNLLETLRSDDGRFLTIPYFHNKLSIPTEKLLPALSILSTFEGAILDAHGFLYYEDDQIHLTNNQFRKLLMTGKLVHPETGEVVEEPFEKVHLYYSVKNNDQH